MRGVKPALREARVVVRQILGTEPWVRTIGSVPLEYHGNAAGGWCILAGSLTADARVIDIGLGEDVSFSESLIARYGCTVDGFDPTPRAIRYAQGRANAHLRLHSYGIGVTSGAADFYLPREPSHVSGATAPEAHLQQASIQVELRTFGEILADLGTQHIDLLKLDVEGAEYDVLASQDFGQHASQVDQICVEFHHRWRTRGKQSTRAAVARLTRLGFVCVWKCRTTNEEFTFIRRERLAGIRRTNGARQSTRTL